MLSILARRLVVFALGAGLVTSGGMVAAVAAGQVVAPVAELGGVRFDFVALQASVWGPVAVGAALAGLALVVLAVWPRQAATSFGIALPSSIADDGLVVRVTPTTLIKLVQYEARQVNGVRGIEPSVGVDENGWRVRCDLVVWRGQSMRDVAEQVTERVRDALHRHTGVNLSTLQIDVSLAPEPVGRVE